jgi:Zn-dependent protease with chaperone function
MSRVLFTLWVASSLLLADDPPAGDEPAADGAGSAGLSIGVAQDGTARFTLTLLGRVPDRPRLEQALEEVAGCRLQDVKDQGTAGWWIAQGRWELPFRRYGLSRQAELNPAPLLKELRRLGVGRVSVTVHVPLPGFIEEARTDADLSGPAAPGVVFHSWAMNTADPDPPRLRVGLGYRLHDLLRFAPFVAVLLFPIGLTLWRRRAALRSPDPSANPCPFAVWFGHWRFLQWLAPATWCLWWLAVCVWDAGRAFQLARGAELRATAFVPLLLFGLLPPVVALCLCRGLSAAVFARVPEAGWTRRAVWRQALWGLFGMLCLVGFGSLGLDALAGGQSRAAGLWFGLAVVGGLVGLVLWTQARNTIPGPLPKGDLRSRIQQLADKAAVPIQQVYLLPAARWRLLSAFAWPGRNVHLTAGLLEHLSRREVDAVVAEELTYLWRHRVWTWVLPVSVMGLELLIGVVLGVLGLYRLIDFERWWLLLALPWFLLWPLAHLRRFAPALDAGAVAVTGDPEALITALHKLHRHGLLPLWAGPRPETATLLLRRLEAIAGRENIPRDRLEEILAGAGTGREQYDPLPAPAAVAGSAAAGPERLFSSALRKRVVRRLNWMLTAAFVLTPPLAGLVAEQTGASGWGRWAVYAGGLAATLALYLLVTRRGAAGTFDWLRRQLRAKIGREGIGIDEEGGVFVGFAPEPYPRLYESFYDWDVGFLFLTADRLCYVGEQARFALQRGQITAVRLGPGGPSWFRTRRVYITWRDEAHDTGGTFSLRAPGVRSRRQVQDPVQFLSERVSTWRTQEAAGKPPPESLAGLATPALGPVAGTSPKVIATPAVFIGALFASEPLALAAVLAFGLSFSPERGGAAWYVLAAVAFMTLVQMVPYWRYRDPGEERVDADE